MNIEKIKSYNQKMLAVVSTLGVILLLMLIIIGLVPEILRLFNRSYSTNNPTGLLADDRIEKINQENLRKQIISYETPWLIDTLKSVYLVPVSIANLKKPEEIIPNLQSESMSMVDIDFNTSKNKYQYYNKRYYGDNFANLILYYALENRILSLFNERILIGNVQAFYFKDDILLTFFSADKDTNKDGVIDLNDVKNLCIYSLKTELLKKISDGENSVEDYQFIENTKDLMIEFNINQYNDNQFSSNKKPNKIMKYEYTSQTLINIIPQKMQADMQKLVEGK